MPSLEDMRAKITPRTRGIVVINPNNPTGRCIRRAPARHRCSWRASTTRCCWWTRCTTKVLYDGVKHTAIASLSTDVLHAHLQLALQGLPFLRLPRRLDGGVGDKRPHATTSKG